MAKIVKYFERDGVEVFDVDQALKDGGWNLTRGAILEVSGLHLRDRNDPSHEVTVRSITTDALFLMYFVNFEEGGWLCLDHAIEQFERVSDDTA